MSLHFMIACTYIHFAESTFLHSIFLIKSFHVFSLKLDLLTSYPVSLKIISTCPYLDANQFFHSDSIQLSRWKLRSFEKTDQSSCKGATHGITRGRWVVTCECSLMEYIECMCTMSMCLPIQTLELERDKKLISRP